MLRKIFSCIGIITMFSSIACCAEPNAASEVKKPQIIQWVETETGKWLVHDINRPAPPVVTPPGIYDARPGTPSPDVNVLFDGNDLSKWESAKKPGKPVSWKLGDGFFEVVKGTGNIRTKQKFGSCQLHLEFATPQIVSGDGQKRGNSGVFLMGMYEIQILDSYNNTTYPDGQCAALYGQAVPLVNVCRKPGEWQSYDIVFHRPLFDGQKVVRKTRFTVFHNGILVHDNVELQGGTGWLSDHAVTNYVPHPDKAPLELQEHGNSVRFRNIWIRELND